MTKYKALVQYKYYGHYGIGDTPVAAWDNLMDAMKKDGEPWSGVASFVLVSWEDDPTKEMNEQSLLGFGQLRKQPARVLKATTKTSVLNAVASL